MYEISTLYEKLTDMINDIFFLAGQQMTATPDVTDRPSCTHAVKTPTKCSNEISQSSSPQDLFKGMNYNYECSSSSQSINVPVEISTAITAGLGPSSPHGTPKKKKKKWLKRKEARNSGNEYYTKMGKKVEKKSFTFSYCTCRYDCSNNVPLSTRKQIFDTFWKSSNWQTQSTFICSSVVVKNVKQKTSPNSLRLNSRNFLLGGKMYAKTSF